MYNFGSKLLSASSFSGWFFILWDHGRPLDRKLRRSLFCRQTSCLDTGHGSTSFSRKFSLHPRHSSTLWSIQNRVLPTLIIKGDSSWQTQSFTTKRTPTPTKSPGRKFFPSSGKSIPGRIWNGPWWRAPPWTKPPRRTCWPNGTSHGFSFRCWKAAWSFWSCSTWSTF